VVVTSRTNQVFSNGNGNAVNRPTPMYPWNPRCDSPIHKQGIIHALLHGLHLHLFILRTNRALVLCAGFLLPNCTVSHYIFIVRLFPHRKLGAEMFARPLRVPHRRSGCDTHTHQGHAHMEI